MAVTVGRILDDVRRAGAEAPVETITHLGLLLERASQNRYDDASYSLLTFPDDWLPIRLAASDVRAIVEALADVIDRHPKLASTAAWALGRAFSDPAVPRLRAALERYWQTDDEIAYQLLIAIDNHGLERSWDLVNRVAREGLAKSRAFAQDLQRVARNIGDWQDTEGSS